MIDLNYRDYFTGWHPADVELEMIRNGGKIIDGTTQIGNGLYFHAKQFQQVVWPEKAWHRWNKLLLSEFCRSRITGILGPANSGKTHESACFGLTMFWANPTATTVMMSSTDSRSLELRVWGELKKYIGLAQETWDPPGRLIASRQMYVAAGTEDDAEDGKPEDFRNGCVGIPCMQGNTFVGLGKYVGVKNETIILIADEASLMGTAFFDAISNLNKNKGFRAIVLGNPKDPTDCLGLICEPHTSLGGYEGIEQGLKTQVWKCRRAKTHCVQLVGTDSPNFDVPEGTPEPYPFLIGREAIKADLDYYGEDNLHFQMMDLGVMPRNAQSRRVITRQLCEVHHAMEEVQWLDTRTKDLIGLDASYSSVGGDRTVLTHLRIGVGDDKLWMVAYVVPPIIVPTHGGDSPEDQIALFVRDYCTKNLIIPGRVFFDSTGRATLMNSFARKWSSEVVPVEFGGYPSNRIVSDSIRKMAKDYYGKKVSELWFTVRHIIEAGQMRKMPLNAIEEGCLREWGMGQRGKIDVEPKENTKKRLGRSPDIFDSLAAGIEGARQMGFQVGRLAKGKTYRSFDDVMNQLKMQKAQLASKNGLRQDAQRTMATHL